MFRRLVRLAVVPALALASLTGLAQAGSRPKPHVAACRTTVTLVAHGQGSPDDLAWDGRTLLISDLKRGTIGALRNGRVHTVAAHIREPEGIVAGSGHTLIVAQQATNSVLEITPAGRRITLARLPLPAGKSGIDGINADGPNAVFVPDSARGRLYVLHLHPRRLTLVAQGMTRPVAAIRWGGATVVADEYADALWRIGPNGRRTRLAPFLVGDDLAVVSGHLIEASLLGQVSEVAPHQRLLSSAFAPATSDPQGLVADGPDAVLVADQARNAIYRIAHLSGCL